MKISDPPIDFQDTLIETIDSVSVKKLYLALVSLSFL